MTSNQWPEPPGDPAQIDALVANLRQLATGTGNLGADTLKITAGILADHWPQGDGSKAFADFGLDLANVGTAEPTLNGMADTLQRYSDALTTAKNDVQTANQAAQVAADDPSGSSRGQAEQAGLTASTSLQDLSNAANEAVATVNSGGTALENLFSGPVKTYIDTLTIPSGGIFGNPGDPLPVGLAGGTTITPVPIQLGGQTETSPFPGSPGGPQAGPVPPGTTGPQVNPIPSGIVNGPGGRSPVPVPGISINFAKKGSGKGGKSRGQDEPAPEEEPTPEGQPIPQGEPTPEGEPTPQGEPTPEPTPTGEKKPPKGGYGKTEVPSWVTNQGEGPYVGETPTQTATRIMDAQYGKGNYPKGPNSEYNKIAKWVGRHF